MKKLLFYNDRLYQLATLVNYDSHVKSQFWSDISVFKIRKMNFQNTSDAGVLFNQQGDRCGYHGNQ